LRLAHVDEGSSEPSEPSQALTKGAAAMQQMAHQASDIASLYERLGSQVIKDPKTDRPQVVVDLKSFQSLLQTVNSILVNATLGTEKSQEQQQPSFSDASLEQLQHEQELTFLVDYCESAEQLGSSNIS
jgi:Cys-tRNA synthase (O-phospho-L-seryl-tRNA:Cys-tRNA synthase)